MVRLPSLPLTGETRRRLQEQDRRWQFKLGLRAFATFIAFVAFLLFAITTGLSREHYGGSDWTDGMPLAPVLLALIYNPIHIAYLLSNFSATHPLHPAYPLTLDTLIWALSVPSIVFSVGVGWFWYWRPITIEFENRYGQEVVVCIGPNLWSKECNPMIYTLGRMEMAANVFLALMLISHFILFIYSCIAAHRHRLARKAARASNRTFELQYSPRSSSHPDPKSRASTRVSSSTHGGSYPPPYYPGGQDHARDERRGFGTQSSITAGGAPMGYGFDKDIESGIGGGETKRESEQQQPPSIPTPKGLHRINSGSGGGFEGLGLDGFTTAQTNARRGGEAGEQGEEGRSPFGDENAVKYA